MNPDDYVPRDIPALERRSVLRAASALESIVDQWSVRLDVAGYAKRLAALPDDKREAAIKGVIETFMMEAAYLARIGDTGGIENQPQLIR
ncbi:MAG: hypothetical protein ACRDAM_15880 [Casimicrobium sp.]